MPRSKKRVRRQPGRTLYWVILMVRTYAKKTDAVTELERKNAEIARRAAGEGMVLLQNKGALPVAVGGIALYGEGASHTVKGGTGSGEVNGRHGVSIREGLEKAGYTIATAKWLDEYELAFAQSKQEYLAEMRRRTGLFRFSAVPYLLAHPFGNPAGPLIGDDHIAPGTNTCLYIVSRQAGENVDRKPEPGSFCLTQGEIANIRQCCKHYKNTILVINAGGLLDLSPLDGMEIQGVIFFCQQGGEGGHAFADLVSGKVTPSGHLSASWPMTYDDVPFGKEFSHLGGNTLHENYREGIYVGYRYYDSFGVAPRYPFGFGLSYTAFAMESAVQTEQTGVTVRTVVTNTGAYPGKAVIQAYVSCPAGRLDKEYQRLAGFAKTESLAPGAAQEVSIAFDMSALASYDASRSQFILEKGDYLVRVGESSRDTRAVALIRLDGEVILSEHHPVCPMENSFDELHAVPHPAPPPDVPVLTVKREAFQTVGYRYGDAPAHSCEKVSQLLAGLSDREKVELCIGSGMDLALPKKRFFLVPGAGGYSTDRLERKGIPSVSYCDGPAGLRLFDVSVVKGNTVRMVNPAMAFMRALPAFARRMMFGNPKKHRPLYQYATAFPVGMSLAQTWNTELLQELGQAVQGEMEAFGAVYWLAPGMNIHRNPLCGRNYEYYSEDPLLSGKMAAAITKGVQGKPGSFVTLKHFACNNREVNREQASSNVGERALREIYLRGFEIAVREGRPGAVMTGYNRVNGVYAAENHDLCTKALRNEWAFDGQVMTDWTTEKYMLNSAKALRAGVDLMMPGISSDRKQIQKALRDRSLAMAAVERGAANVLRGIVESDIYRLFLVENQKRMDVTG